MGKAAEVGLLVRVSISDLTFQFRELGPVFHLSPYRLLPAVVCH